MNISKSNIYVWPIRNVIRGFVISYILVFVILTLIYLISHADGVSYWGLLPYMGILLMGFIVIILIPGSFRSYVALFLLSRQEKYLNVDMQKELKGKRLQGTEYEAYYEDENWFICYGGSYVNVFNRKYIKEISKVTKTKTTSEVKILTVDNKKCTFILPNLYNKNFRKFLSWCKCKN